MRLLALHLRGRHGGPVLLALAGVALACWLLALLAEDTGMLVAVLGPLAAVSVLGFALAGADPALERVTPTPWTRWRAAELAACAVAAAAALLPALAIADAHEGALLRNLAGLGGLTALGVTIVGARLAWVLPSAWVFVAAAVGPRMSEWLTWPVQPDAATSAPLAAMALAMIGAAAHVVRGAAQASQA